MLWNDSQVEIQVPNGLLGDRQTCEEVIEAELRRLPREVTCTLLATIMQAYM